MRSKNFRGGVLERVDLKDPHMIHKLRLIELSDKTNLVEFEDYNRKIASSDTNSLNILYVIDMQNDFIKLPPDGAFSVHGGNSVTDNIDKFIRKHKAKFEKIIFSRDYHEKNHCGFFDQGGRHPPHCIQTNEGAEFDPKIKDLLNEVLLKDEDSDDYKKTEIVFKAMEMESFGASKAMNKTGKWYNVHSASCKVNCDGNPNCLDLTGGFKIDDKNSSIENSITTTDLKVKYDIKDILNEIHTKDINNIKKKHNIYITGLAGCHCVSETAINIADYLSSANPELDYQIYIIEDLTRYAFVPLFVLDFSQDNNSFDAKNILERLKESKQTDDLSYYIFQNMNNGKFKLLTKEEVRSNAGIIEDSVINFRADYFHYLAPLNITINKYKEYNTKIKLLMSPNDKYLPKRLRQDLEVMKYNPSLFGSSIKNNNLGYRRRSIGGKKKSKKNRIAKKRRRPTKKRKYTKKKKTYKKKNTYKKKKIS